MAIESSGDETARLAELRGYGVLDTENEPEFDALVRDAAAVCGTQVALISLVDEKRQWFKAKVGIDASETPRAISFCTHAISGPDVFEINDATSDARFSANPLVTGDPNIRFYAGAPLKTPSGRRIGTICVIDNVVRAPLSEHSRRKLQQLADETMEAFERRRATLNVA